MPMKMIDVCRKCGAPKDYEIKSGKRAGKLHTYCRKCLRDQVKKWEVERPADWNAKRLQEWLTKNPDKKLRYGMRRYGVDEVWYKAKLEKQGFVCAICKRDETQRKWRGRLSVDHCHQTGKLRGLLCNTCNMRLAALETKHWMDAACQYLAEYQP